MTDATPANPGGTNNPRSNMNADAFARVLGKGRGPNGALLRELLVFSHRQLDDAVAECTRLTELNDHMRHGRRDLKQRLTEAVLKCSNAEATIELLTIETLRHRYTAVRNGIRDSALLVPMFEQHHQGIWTPGRPYLTGQHAYDPNDWACYQVRGGGVPPGQRPGESDRWERCTPRTSCPTPNIVPLRGHEANGRAARQRGFWWDRNRRRWPLSDLSDEHLAAVITWLRASAHRLYRNEVIDLTLNLPCPVWAYTDAHAWMADTPLMHALRSERNRRSLFAAQRRT